MPLLLLLPVQKFDDLRPHERNKHPVEEPWTEPPSHGKEQPQGQYKLDRAEHTSSLSSTTLRQYQSLCSSWTCPVLVAWLCPSPEEMTFTPLEGAPAYTLKFYDSYFSHGPHLYPQHVQHQKKSGNWQRGQDAVTWDWDIDLFWHRNPVSSVWLVFMVVPPNDEWKLITIKV